MKKSEHLSVSEASVILGISPATVKNWIKLGKLKGTKDGASFWLYKKDVEKASSRLESSDALRQRRNKSRLNSNFIPKSYISNSSPNYKTIKALICDKEVVRFPLNLVLFHYANLLMKSSGISDELCEHLSSELLSGIDYSVSGISKCDNSSTLTSSVSAFLDSYPLMLVPSEDTLGMLYLSLRGLQDKKATGAYYTPFYVVDELISEALSDIEDYDHSKTFIDPACGTGNFLLRLPESIPLTNVHGIDIDNTAVLIARINLAIKYRIDSESDLNTLKTNIVSRDFLFDSDNKTYDIALGNPPWGYSYPPSYSSVIRHDFISFDGKGKPESFSLFIERALEKCSEVTFLLPETILGSDYHRGIRKYIMDSSKVLSISYLGEVFDKVQCPSVIMKMSKSRKPNLVKSSFYKKESKSGKRLSLIKSFEVPVSRIDSDNFNILADNDEYEILTQMNSIPHIYLKDNAEFALGIVTGSNSSLITSSKEPGSEPIIKGKDISKYRIDTGHSYTVFVPDRYQQVAPTRFYRAKNKLFYRFIANEPVVALDTKGLVSLNSANIIIPHIEGYDNAYIMAILNSSAMSFYYRHTCKNMKVLRSALESLPIPICDKDLMHKISSLAMDIQKSCESGSAPDNMVKRLDKYINSLYNLNADQEKNILRL